MLERERRNAIPSGASSRVVAPSTERMRGMLCRFLGGCRWEDEKERGDGERVKVEFFFSWFDQNNLRSPKKKESKPIAKIEASKRVTHGLRTPEGMEALPALFEGR